MKGSMRVGRARLQRERVFQLLRRPRRVGAILRTGNRPSLRYREFSVNVKLPGGAIAFRAAREADTTNDSFSCGGLTLSVNEPTRTWNLSFKGSLTRVALPVRLATKPGLVLKSSPVEDCEIDLQWRASSPCSCSTVKERVSPRPARRR